MSADDYVLEHIFNPSGAINIREIDQSEGELEPATEQVSKFFIFPNIFVHFIYRYSSSPVPIDFACTSLVPRQEHVLKKAAPSCNINI